MKIDNLDKEKIFIIPHGVNFDEFKIIENENKPFTFLFNKGWRGGTEDRGGFQYLLKAFDVLLIFVSDVDKFLFISTVYVVYELYT